MEEACSVGVTEGINNNGESTVHKLLPGLRIEVFLEFISLNLDSSTDLPIFGTL